MTLETIKTTHLVGNLKIEETLVKQYVVDINEKVSQQLVSIFTIQICMLKIVLNFVNKRLIFEQSAMRLKMLS